MAWVFLLGIDYAAFLMPMLLGRRFPAAISFATAFSCMARKSGKSLSQESWSNDSRSAFVCCIRKAEYKSR